MACMEFKEYKRLVFSDLYRVTGGVSFRALCRNVILGEAFQYVFWMRSCRYALNASLAVKFIYYPLSRFMLRHVTYKLGISIPPSTQIGEGFFIGHFGGIVVNEKCVIGKNCNISHRVTLGQSLNCRCRRCRH